MRWLLTNGPGLALSFAAVLGFLGIINAMLRRGTIDSFAARKVIHVGAAHWWLLAMAMFDDPWAASLGPACALAAAAAAPRLNPIPRPSAAAGGAGRRRDLGAILYAASLLVLVNLSWRAVIAQRAAAVGVLVMGWGDGLAGLAGSRAGGAALRIWGQRKTLRGTAVMFAASLAAAFLLTVLREPHAPSLGSAALAALGTAAAATAIEVLTPPGLDNLTIPLGTAFFYSGAFSGVFG